MKSIEEWTKEVDRMKYDILGWSMGINDEGGNYWQRNKTKFFTLTLMVTMVVIFRILGWELLFRVSGLMLILYIVTNVIYLFKWLFGKTFNRK